MAKSLWQKAYGKKPSARSPVRTTRVGDSIPTGRARNALPELPLITGSELRSVACGDTRPVRRRSCCQETNEGSRRAGLERSFPQGENRVVASVLGDGLGERTQQGGVLSEAVGRHRT